MLVFAPCSTQLMDLKILTFDEGGVSGHPNHISTHVAMREYADRARQRSGFEPVAIYQLKTTCLLRKYLGPFDVLWSVFVDGMMKGRVFVGCSAPWMSARAMRAHASQYVWYRRLFVLFSRYVYMNTLEPMHGHPQS